MAKTRVELRHASGETTVKQGEAMSGLIKRYKLVILGAAASGKSSMVFRYTHGSYLNDMERTWVASFSSIFLDKSLKFDSWEVSGEERWHSLAHLYYKDAQAALIVYDVQDQYSLVCAKAWIREIRKKLGADVVIAIAASKIDLWDDLCIDSKEVQSYPQENDCIFLETSAKTGLNITKLFVAIAEKLEAKPNPRQSKIYMQIFLQLQKIFFKIFKYLTEVVSYAVNNAIDIFSFFESYFYISFYK